SGIPESAPGIPVRKKGQSSFATEVNGCSLVPPLGGATNRWIRGGGWQQPKWIRGKRNEQKFMARADPAARRIAPRAVADAGRGGSWRRGTAAHRPFESRRPGNLFHLVRLRRPGALRLLSGKIRGRSRDAALRRC